MGLLRWIWAYLFDCVHFHTTWPHQNHLGHAYVCCLDCGTEMPYSLEYMQIVRQDRKRNTLDSRFPATASLIIAGALLLLTPSYALAETAPPSADRSQRRPQISGVAKVEAESIHSLSGFTLWALAHGSSFC
jgi:hypothetical protein